MAPLALLVRRYVSRCRCVLQSALAICSIFTPAACLSLTHTVSGVVSLCGVGFSILLQAMVTLLWHSAVCPNAARTPAARTPAARMQPAAAAAAHLRKALAWLLRALNDAAEVAAEPPLLSRGGWRPLSHVASRPRSRPAVLSCDRRRYLALFWKQPLSAAGGCVSCVQRSGAFLAAGGARPAAVSTSLPTAACS